MLLQDRIDIAEKSHQGVISDYLNVIQPLSKCEGRTGSRRQVKQVTSQVDEYRETIRQRVTGTEAASAKVTNSEKRLFRIL